MKGFLLDENNDLQVSIKRGSDGLITQGLTIGDTKLQDAFLVLKLNQGDLKEDPIVGTNLLRNIRAKINKLKIKTDIKKGFLRAGISFDEIKEELLIVINEEGIEL